MVYKRGSVALALVAMGALAGVGRAAETFTADALSNTGVSFTVGNATYSNFVYTGTTAASTVTVTASTSGNTSEISFGRTSGTWTLADGNSVINYDVTFAAPVTSIGLDFVASATGGGVSSVYEDAVDGVSGVDYTTPNLGVIVNSGMNLTTSSLTFPGPVSSLNIVKSIDISGDVGDTGTIMSVDNTYTSSVPEPASLSLLGLGAIGLIRRRRRSVG